MKILSTIKWTGNDDNGYTYASKRYDVSGTITPIDGGWKVAVTSSGHAVHAELVKGKSRTAKVAANKAIRSAAEQAKSKPAKPAAKPAKSQSRKLTADERRKLATLNNRTLSDIYTSNGAQCRVLVCTDTHVTIEQGRMKRAVYEYGGMRAAVASGSGWQSFGGKATISREQFNRSWTPLQTITVERTNLRALAAA